MGRRAFRKSNKSVHQSGNLNGDAGLPDDSGNNCANLEVRQGTLDFPQSTIESIYWRCPLKGSPLEVPLQENGGNPG